MNVDKTNIKTRLAKFIAGRVIFCAIFPSISGGYFRYISLIFRDMRVLGDVQKLPQYIYTYIDICIYKYIDI